MKTYTNKQRFAALKRHKNFISIKCNRGFTVITQHVDFKTIEEFCDIIINYEKFHKAYGETIINNFLPDQLYYKRKNIFFSENRLLTKQETDDCIKMYDLKK